MPAQKLANQPPAVQPPPKPAVNRPAVNNKPTKKPASTRAIPTCPKCSKSNIGVSSCCIQGGAWAGKCGKLEKGALYTYDEGIRACSDKAPSINQPNSNLPRNNLPRNNQPNNRRECIHVL